MKLRKHSPAGLTVLKALKKHGPHTAMELLRYTGRTKFDSNIRARLTELHYKGAVKALTRRECKVTGRAAIVWKVMA